MVHGAFTEELPTCIIKYIPLHTPAVTMSISAVIGDVTAEEPAGLLLRPGGRLSYLLARIASNTLGSNRVDVSPSSRPSATSRSSRRMILPLRVFGSSGTT